MTYPTEGDVGRKPQSRHRRRQNQERLGQREVDFVREEVCGATLQPYNVRMVAGRRIERGRPEGFVVLKTLFKFGASLLNDSVPGREEPVSASARTQGQSIAHRRNIQMQSRIPTASASMSAEHCGSTARAAPLRLRGPRQHPLLRQPRATLWRLRGPKDPSKSLVDRGVRGKRLGDFWL